MKKETKYFKVGVVLRGFIMVEAESKQRANDIVEEAQLDCDLDTLWKGFYPEEGESVSIGRAVPSKWDMKNFRLSVFK